MSEAHAPTHATPQLIRQHHMHAARSLEGPELLRQQHHQPHSCTCYARQLCFRQRQSSACEPYNNASSHGSHTALARILCWLPLCVLSLPFYAGRCGNPLCRQPWKWQQPAPWRQPAPMHADGDGALRGLCFCGSGCEAAVHAHAAQLGDPMARLKPGLRKRMEAPSHTRIRCVGWHAASGHGHWHVCAARRCGSTVHMGMPRQAWLCLKLLETPCNACN